MLASEHGLDAVHGLRGAHVDRDDASMGDVATLESQVLHPDDLHVVDVGAQALNQARVLAPLDALADQLWQHGSGHDYLLLAAYCTALTMLIRCTAEVAGDALAESAARCLVLASRLAADMIMPGVQ